MAAKRKIIENHSGQALMEFIVVLPFVMLFTWHLIKVNMAINTSIVGQKSTRAYVFLKMLNHRDGPGKKEYEESPSSRSAFFLYVSANAGGGDDYYDDGDGGATKPAPVVSLGAGVEPRDIPGARNDPYEAESNFQRQHIRIRTALGICTSRKPSIGNTLGAYCGRVEQ